MENGRIQTFTCHGPPGGYSSGDDSDLRGMDAHEEQPWNLHSASHKDSSRFD